MYVPKHFKIYELLPRDFYESNKHRGNSLFYIFDDRLLLTLDELRTIFGKMYINTWAFGEKIVKKYGYREYSGWRPFDSKIGAKLSQHKFGRAGDILFEEHKAENVRKWIINNYFKFNYITGMETGVPWLHIDVRNHDGLFLFGKGD